MHQPPLCRLWAAGSGLSALTLMPPVRQLEVVLRQFGQLAQCGFQGVDYSATRRTPWSSPLAAPAWPLGRGGPVCFWHGYTPTHVQGCKERLRRCLR